MSISPPNKGVVAAAIGKEGKCSPRKAASLCCGLAGTRPAGIPAPRAHSPFPSEVCQVPLEARNEHSPRNLSWRKYILPAMPTYS